MINMLAIDGQEDQIVKCLAASRNAKAIDTYKDLSEYDISIPVIFRSMAQRKTVSECKKTKRNYYYIDTGYVGNIWKRKDWHRVVFNNMQHTSPRFDLPENRFNAITKGQEYVRFEKWKKTGSNILVVTPSEKPCKFYGIDRNRWVEDTLSKLKKHTDRKIIIRDKGLRKDRIGKNSIYNQFVDDDIFAVVTYNSIAATEAIGFGIPAFTLAPNVADNFCLKDLSKIETPLYTDEDKVKKWQHWLGYCQYTPQEMANGLAFSLIEEYDLK
jgi:hypothetical protein